MGELLWFSAGSRHDVEFLGRRRNRIARIGQVTALIEAVFHPIEHPSLESFVDFLLEVGGILFGLLFGRRSPPGKCDPLIIGAEDRRSTNALNLERLSARLIHSEKPNRA